MKKLLISFFLLFFCCVPAFASDFEFKPAVMADVLYDTKAGAIVPVASLQLMTAFDGLVETRAMLIGNPEEFSNINRAGVGIGVNLVVLTNKLGQKWTANFINPTIGVAPVYNFSTKQTSIGIYMTVIKVAF